MRGKSDKTRQKRPVNKRVSRAWRWCVKRHHECPWLVDGRRAAWTCHSDTNVAIFLRAFAEPTFTVGITRVGRTACTKLARFGQQQVGENVG